MKLTKKIVATTTLLLLLGSLLFIFIRIYDLSRPPQPGEMNESGLILVLFYIAGIFIAIFTIIHLVYYLLLFFNKNTNNLTRFYFYLSIILTIILIIFAFNINHILTILLIAPLVIIDIISITTSILHKSYSTKLIS